MANIASKNLYDLLGNDPELDPDREPEPPTKAIDKPAPRTGKRNVASEAPTSGSGGSRSRGGRGGASGNEGAFRDRGAGSYQNRSKPTDDSLREDRHSNRLRDDRGRGGRGGRGGFAGRGARTGDRHSRTGIAEHDKQAAHGWGGQSGGEEWADEKAGEVISKEEEKEGFDTVVDPPVNADGAVEGEGAAATEPEPEDKTKSYADYLAEQAEKKLALSGNRDVRKPNEGSAKKFPEGKPISREEEEAEYFPGQGGKTKRARERKEKAIVELDDARLHGAPDTGFGGRGRGRGRGGRGELRGEGRGRGGRGRGEFRGGRGGRGGQSSAPRVDDQSAFPSLGA